MKKMNLRGLMLCFMASLGMLLYASEPWTGGVSEPTLTGTTYSITTGEELAWIAQESATNSFAGMTISIDDEIDLGGQDWLPIGSEDVEFEGAVIGNCNAIINLRVKSTNGLHRNYGLFGVLGTSSVVQDLALLGDVYRTDKYHTGYENIGTFAGINKGKIVRSFNMVEIDFTAAEYVGGIVGRNEGLIDHCYNVGAILNAGSFAGGLAGENTGTISNCYEAGYLVSANSGALVSQQLGTILNCYYDGTLSLKSGLDNDKVNANVGKTETINMPSIFEGDSEYVTEDQLYPQLRCFAEKNPDLSVVSAAPIYLAQDQRADDETIEDDFTMYSQVDGWSVTGTVAELIKIEGFAAKVEKDCNGRELPITAKKGNYSKNIYIKLAQYPEFKEGTLKNEIDSVCLDAPLVLEKAYYAKVSGGRDKDIKKYPYYYKYEIYRDGETEPFIVDSAMTAEDGEYMDIVHYHSFKSTALYAEEMGLYKVLVWAHDSKCNLAWEKSAGEYYYRVLDKFDAGKMGAYREFYGMPDTLMITGHIAASGGKQPYEYKWYYRFGEVDDDTNDTTWFNQNNWDDLWITEYQAELFKDSTDSAAVSFRPTQAGDYFFNCRARDSRCCDEKEFYIAEGFQHIRIYDILDAGAIENVTKVVCEVPYNYTIGSQRNPSGGNKKYEYRWRMNGAIIDGATDKLLNINNLTKDLESGEYVFTREVKDGSGYADWTVSENSYTLKIFDPFDAGEIENDTTFVIGNRPYIVSGLNVRGVTGGDESRYERWWLVSEWGLDGERFQNNKIIPDEKGDELGSYEIDHTGLFAFTRRAWDHQQCSGTVDDGNAMGIKYVLVMDALTAGAIEDVAYRFCQTELSEIILEEEAPQGGSEQYTYQWYMNNVAIEGATSSFLSLEGLTFKQGEHYTFRRQVVDGSGAFEPVFSDGVATVDIYSVFNAGQIDTPAAEKVCNEVSENADLHFVGTETIAASGDGDEYTYRWIIDAIHGNDTTEFKVYDHNSINIDTVLTAEEYNAVQQPVIFSMRREALNPLCNAEWYRTDGEIIKQVSKKQIINQVVTVCAEEYPISGEVTLLDGSTQSYTISRPDTVAIIYDETAEGCERQIRVTGKAHPVPVVEVDALGKLCMESDELKIPFTVISGDPDRYAITFDERLGRNDTIRGTLAPTDATLVISDLGDIPKGDYNIYLQFSRSDDTNGCQLNTYSVQFSYLLSGLIFQKWDDVLFVDNNRAILKPGQVEMASHFVAFQWYKDGQPIDGATEQFYYPSDGNLQSGDYSVMLTDDRGNVYQTCDQTITKEVSGMQMNLFVGDESTMEFYTITGQRIGGKPTVQGTYILQMKGLDGEQKTVKFILR